MLELNALKQLMRTVANANPSPNYSYNYNGEQFSFNDLNDTLNNEINQYLGSEELFEDNHRKVFSLMAEVIDEVVPNRLINAYGQFAEIRTYPQGTKPIFRRKMGRTRAKQFVTRVGLAGVYEVFKLGEETFEVKTSAIGAAAQIGHEEFLDGRVNFAELMQIILDGMDELIYREIAAALQAAIVQLPAANRVVATGFDAPSMDYLIQTAAAYGNPVIYCTREFAVKMLDKTDWAQFSDRMKDEIWTSGYLANYKGCPVVILPQSLEDETNSRKVIDPGYCWVIPSGVDNRPVKVAFEGTTQMRQRDNKDDWSRDVQVYRKVGVGVMMTNNIFSYVDIQLLGKLDNVNEAGIDFPVGQEAAGDVAEKGDATVKNLDPAKSLTDLIDGDVTLAWIGLTAKVHAKFKKVSAWTKFSSTSNNTGHFYPLTLDDAYKDQAITCVNTEGKAKTETDTNWVLKIDKNKTFAFYANGINILTLDFTEATLSE